MPSQPTRLRDVQSPPAGTDDAASTDVALERAETQSHADWQALRQAVQAARQPLTTADTLITAWTDHLRRFLRRLLSAPYLAAVVPCVVTAVDRAAHTCTVRVLAAGQLVPGNTLGGVAFGATAPKVNDQTAVRIVNRLLPSERGAPVIAEASVKVAQNRGLYQKRSGQTSLLRYEWPPPSTPVGWDSEVIHSALPSNPELFGGATPASGAQEAVLKEGVIVAGHPDGDPSGPDTHIVSQRFTHYADDGAGEVTRTYSPNPPYAVIGAIAYDGFNTAGAHTRVERVTIPSGPVYGLQPFLAADPMCCQPAPFDPSQTFCIHQPSYGYSWVAVGSFPEGATVRDDAVIVNTGDLGAMLVRDQFAQPAVSVNLVPVEGTGGTYYVFSASGCHWVGPPEFLSFNIEWTDGVWTPVDIGPPPSGGVSVDQGTTPWYQVRAVGAWHRQGTALAAWVVSAEDRTVRGFTPTLSLMLYTTGLGNRALPLLHGQFAIGLFLTLDTDDQIVVWGTAPGYLAAYYRWTPGGTWTQVETFNGRGLGQIQVISPDGQDILGWTNEVEPAQIASTDGGATWTRTPTLAAGGTLFGGLAFLGE